MEIKCENFGFGPPEELHFSYKKMDGKFQVLDVQRDNAI
jgi:hypothetical protein